MTGEARFVSKRDAWLTWLIWLGAIVLLAGSVAVARSPMAPLVKYPLGLATVALAVVMIWMLYGTTYTVTGDTLIARCGPFAVSVLLQSIESISPSHNPLASPACSLDRLFIEYRGSRFGLLVSPVAKHEFLDEIVRRVPDLRREREGVVRRSNA